VAGYGSGGSGSGGGGGGARVSAGGRHDAPAPRGFDYEEMAAELEACRAEMSLMQIKIDKLTRLVHLKDKRIEDLQRLREH